jgi:ubiquinone/menaquinone biosynthesis C-methylase UbiE
MLDLGKVNPGMKVLDVATGRGEPAIPAAHRVLPDGHVLGLDADSSVLEIARERARNEGVHNLELVVSDLASIDGIPEQYFDLAIARWGLMYFQEPVRSLQVVRRALANSGRLVAAVWTDPDSAVFFQLPRAALILL